MEAQITKVADLKTISNYGVIFTPALVVDGVVKVAGKVPRFEDIKAMIQ